MNRRGEESLGQALTSFPALVLVVIIMVLFVIVSGIFAKEHYESYNLAENFLDDYVIFNGSSTSVSNLLDKFCSNIDLGNEIGPVLRKHFLSKYGVGNSFVLSYVLGDYNGVKLYSWAGSIENYLDSEGNIIDYEGYGRFFDSNNKDVIVLRHCNAVDLYFKKGGFVGF